MGKVGSGKSIGVGLSLASIMDKKFNIARVVFTPDDFMKCVRSDMPYGSFILADEIGSWMPARDYMTLANKLLSLVLQTFRYKRIGVIWTIPQNRQADINEVQVCRGESSERQYLQEVPCHHG